MRASLDSTFFLGHASAAAPGDPSAADRPLEPYDNLLVLRQGGWSMQRMVVIAGQVKSPGRYSLRSKTERLSDLIERAGGLTEQAYPGGIEFYRAYAGTRPTGTDRLPRVYAPTSGPRDSVRGLPERVGIDLPRVLQDSSFRDNVVLVGGDSIVIPEFNPIIMVQGAVNSPGPVAYAPGKNLDWYVNAAGGYTQQSDKSHPYVTQPNGEREGVKRRAVFADHVPNPRPGAVVFVATRTGNQDIGSNTAALLTNIAQILGVVVTIVAVARH